MRVTRAGKLILLTPRELALLELLMSAPSRLFSRERILANVWGVHEDPMTNIVDVYIRRLRSKIDDGHAFSADPYPAWLRLSDCPRGSGLSGFEA